MNINLYNFSGEPRTLDKYLESVDTVNIIAITDDTNILSPRIVIATRSFNFNYAYIPNFNRYYYITNIEILDAQRIALNCKVDVLMSHKSAIRNSTVIADRSTNRGNNYLPDNTIPAKDSAEIKTVKMQGTPFNTTSYVLQVSGR